jgi:hypothetical protein
MASHWLKLWTATAIAVALQAGLGCQARRLPAMIQVPDTRSISANHPPDGHPDMTSQPSRHWPPNTRVFRGSVSSASSENDLIAR